MSHRGMPKTRVIRERLRKEAQQRQEEYDTLSLEQKLDKLPPAPAAAKQRAKLERLAVSGNPDTEKVSKSKAKKSKKD